ncbi:MAG: UDP-3-O-acyl-N-acetylglucosamine deacetylase, partial [Alphaproteobacteria bacterium]|nr:UDP-3-O-acyl-N-acetylglucosamine deacetylase [Alphaproteobacteria bacterium]
MFEQTLKTFFEFEGTGLHTGRPVTLTVYPQTTGGIRFRRCDILFSEVIPARYDFVINTRMNTMIGTDETNSVSTIEHFMGALYMAGIDHALIEINGPELPLADGSAQPFLDAIEAVGLLDLETKRKTLVVKKEIVFENETARVELHPCDTFKITQSIDFAHEPTIGRQEHTATIDTFATD